MKVFISIASCLVLAAILSTHQANCYDIIGIKVGKEFLKDFKKYGFELFKTKLQIWEQFVEELLENSKETIDQQADLLTQKNYLSDVLKKVDTMDEDEIMGAIYDFVEKSYIKRSFPVPKDREHARIINSALLESELHSRLAELKFVENIGAAWKKLYDNIPAEELENHRGYRQITEAIAAAKQSEANGRDVYKLCLELVRFFDNKDWLYVLGISRDGDGKRIKSIIN